MEADTSKVKALSLALVELLTGKAIDSSALALAGKLHPARAGSGIKEDTTHKRLYVPILKANDEEQTITGVVLQPEVVDAQGDIMDAQVIRQAAHKFLAAFNQRTKLGLQHQTFKNGQFSLAESYLAPGNMVIGGKTVKEGSWVMTVKVLDSKLWSMVKAGKLTGFSIGGRARVRQVASA